MIATSAGSAPRQTGIVLWFTIIPFGCLTKKRSGGHTRGAPRPALRPAPLRRHWAVTMRRAAPSWTGPFEAGNAQRRAARNGRLELPENLDARHVEPGRVDGRCDVRRSHQTWRSGMAIRVGIKECGLALLQVPAPRKVHTAMRTGTPQAGDSRRADIEQLRGALIGLRGCWRAQANGHQSHHEPDLIRARRHIIRAAARRPRSDAIASDRPADHACRNTSRAGRGLARSPGASHRRRQNGDHHRAGRGTACFARARPRSALRHAARPTLHRKRRRHRAPDRQDEPLLSTRRSTLTIREPEPPR